MDDLLAAVPVSDAARADLRRRMAAPGRRYHGPWHLALLWTRHLALGRGSDLHEPRVAQLIASAIAFHDAVLEPGRTDNERASAALWREAAAAAAVTARSTGWRAPSRRRPTTSPRPGRRWRRARWAPRRYSSSARGSGCWTWI
ncbi:MAG TPA: hypothetical protein VEX11_17160 [Acetobacteraceae bacterium]|nr:hypothetical protein [Acetobacteraceae bacterium]